MASYTQYKKKNGQVAWKVAGYLGTDPQTGKQVNLTRRGFATKKEAQLAFNRLVVDIEKNGLQKNNNGTFESVYRLWLETYELTVKESSFVKLQQKFDNHILPALGDKDIKKITVADVQKFANDMCKKNTQYKEYVSNVSRIFDFAMKEVGLKSNPVHGITMPRRKKVLEEDEVKYFTKEELQTFLDYAKEHETPLVYTFFYLLAKTGCRQGELLGLQWDCIDFTNKTLKIRQTLTRGKNRRLYLEQPKTKKSRRTIPLSEETIQALKQWRRVQREDMLKLGINTMNKKQILFTDLENNFIELSHPRLWMQRICKRSGLPMLSPHALRHTFATLLISQGVNFKTVSELLGHSNIGMTLDIYAGVYDDQKKDTIEMLDHILIN